MELTGKCKEEFEKWFTNSDNHKGFDAEQIALDRKYRLKVFYQLYPSMQYGVYVDFFDSVGIFIEITPYFDSVTEVMLWFFTLENKKCIHLNSHLENKAKTRSEARLLAIEKANELHNEFLNK